MVGGGVLAGVGGANALKTVERLHFIRELGFLQQVQAFSSGDFPIVHIHIATHLKQHKHAVSLLVFHH